MDTQDAGFAALIGAILPFAIAFIIQTDWKQSAKAVAAFVICALAAAVTSFLSDEVRIDDPSWDWVTWFGVIYGSAMITYSRLWKPTNVAPTIETKTNLR